MANEPQVLRRNRYFIEGAPDIPHSSRNHVDDWAEYHLPLARMQLAHLHDWGIASGLEVSVTPDGQQIQVEPGVAVDANGEFIALSAAGEADISVAAPGEAGRQISAPFQLSTAGHSGHTRYLTVQFAQRLRLTQGAGGKLEQTPWLRLQATAGEGAYVEDGGSIILAVVEVDTAGIATVHERGAGVPHGRRLMGTTTAAVHLRRPAMRDGRVGQAGAAEIRPGVTGGLRVTVPEAADEIVFDQADAGAFATFAVHATTVQLHGRLSVQEDIQAQRDLRVDGVTTLQGDVTVGTGTTNPRLTLHGQEQTSLELATTTGGHTLALRLDTGGGVLATGTGQGLRLQAGDQAQQLVLGADGRVGINTATPAARLQVLHVTQDANGDTLILGPTNASHLRLGYHGDYSWVQSHGGRPLAINPLGNNVGIGTTTPAGRLEVQAGGHINVILNNTGSQDHMTLTVGASGTGIHFGNSNRFFVSADPYAQRATTGFGNELVSILPDGKVGIGTSTPRTHLHVLQRIATGLDFQSAGAVTFFPPDGFAWFHIDNGPAGGRPIGRLRISHGGQPGDREIISILQNHDVGIGTPSPLVRLHVVGNRIRLTKASNAQHFLDLRADGSALDLESRGADLFINNHGATFTRIRNFVNISSRDYKENIVELSACEASRLLRSLNAVKFQHKDDDERKQHVGFIAEEIPDLLSTPDKKAYKPFDILAILTRVVQYQQEQIQQLLDKTIEKVPDDQPRAMESTYCESTT